MPISEIVAAKVLSTCARHCCICRRFRPGHVQIHHIVEVSQGGGDDFDNLIPICISCHADVHSQSQLTRRFTATELRIHRDTVYDLVSRGLLPSREAISGDAVRLVSDSVVQRLQELGIIAEAGGPGLSRDAATLLLAAMCEESPISFVKDGTFLLQTGQQRFYFKLDEHSPHPKPLAELLSRGAIAPCEGGFAVTPEGDKLGKGMISTTAKFTEVKVKCMLCGLHFVLLTWFPERHNAHSIFCPECGQPGISFLVWQQSTFGFIFQHVPGHAEFKSEH